MRADHYPRDRKDCPDNAECAEYYHQYLPDDVKTCPCCGRSK